LNNSNYNNIKINIGTMGSSIWLFQIRNTPEFKEDQRKLLHEKSDFSLLNPIFKK